jgi:predicted phage terminase large subunit-like protein
VTDDPAYAAVVAEECRKSLHFFTRRMFKARRGFRWADNWHHQEICRALMRVFRGECTRLIINVPPRYSKTEIAVVNFMAWALGHWPDAEFIHTSYSATLAENNTAATRQLVLTDEYRAIFPEVHLRDDAQAKGDWRTTAGGVVYSAGSGGTLTGFGAGKMRVGFGGAIIIDDPHKADEASSDKVRGNVIEWFGNTVESRKNDPQRTPIILIMQRLHEADLTGFLLAGGNGEKWEHLNIPALQHEGTPEECAMWPAKHTVDQLRIMESKNPYVFNGQYQQRPAPLAGGEFKPDVMTTVDAIPAGTRFVRAWDLAGTDQGGDWTAGMKLGVQPDGRYIIANVVREQRDPEDVEKMLKATATGDGTGVDVAIPQDPGQAGKSQARALVRLLSGFTVKALPVSGDKVTRARPFAAQVNAGNVDMLRGDWNEGLKAEMRNFPNGKHDDQVDAGSLAFDRLTSGSTGLLDFYRQEAEEAERLRQASEAQSANNTVQDMRGEDKKQSSGPAAFMRE